MRRSKQKGAAADGVRRTVPPGDGRPGRGVRRFCRTNAKRWFVAEHDRDKHPSPAAAFCAYRGESVLTKPRERYALAFFLALGVAAALFLPFLILDRGYFIYYGDFNVQQIPFYQMAHDAVRAGEWGWSFTTDLGANFIGSYSFYLLGSPFFWLTLPFPSDWVPYLMAPLLMLKLACCSLAACAYLRRFVRPDYAVIGGLLYAFSGFSIYNIFFNHFHEAMIYFPLMLLGLERHMADHKRGLFALSVCLSALSNYYFFIGQAIFLLLYFFVRLLSGAGRPAGRPGGHVWEVTPRRVLWLFFEAVVGTAMAGVLLLPSYLAVIQNSRTESLLTGWDALIYSTPQRLLDILHSFFFPQDIPARPNFFPDADNKWASMSAWIPVFGCAGALAFYQSRGHRHWLKRMLLCCLLCAVVPLFNAMFQLFNSMYYARWYYMMVLLLVLATVWALGDDDREPASWGRGIGWAVGITAFFALCIGLLPQSLEPDPDTGKLEIGLMAYPDRFFVYVGIALVSLALTAALVRLHRNHREVFTRWALVSVCGVSLLYSWYFVGLGKANGNYRSSYVIDHAIEGGNFELPDRGWARMDTPGDMDNLGMFWQMPALQAFHSIVPGSVMEFYESVGVSRSVGSRPDTSHYALRSFLSVRWLFDYQNEDGAMWKEDADYFEQNGVPRMPGWVYYGQQEGYTIYENTLCLPMGFTYDSYLSRSEYDALPSNQQRELSLLKTLVVEDEDVPAVCAVLPAFDPAGAAFSQAAYTADCASRAAGASDDFTQQKNGFSASITLEQENYVFFSVPYEAGWRASVNGADAEILRAGVGFMAVKCPAGESEIVFSYQTPGLAAGAWISLGAAAALALYLGGSALWDRRKRGSR